MTSPRRERLSHEVPPWVRDDSFYFITINSQPRALNQLCIAETGKAVLASAEFQHKHLLWHCRLMLLMPDHLHAILAFPDLEIKRTITNWKKYLARTQAIKWQRDFFDHRPRTAAELNEKSDYILMNPVRRGLCSRPDDWPWIYRPNDRTL